MLPLSPDLAHFLAIPWCAALFNSPSTTILPSPVASRIPNPSTEGALFAETLQTPDTISALLSFYRNSQNTPTKEIHTLITLGYLLNGYPNTAHGGIIVSIIDEAMSFILKRNKELGTLSGLGDLVTADLRVKFIRPVKTPQTVVVEARLREVKGRKYTVEADLKDGEGTVLAQGEALWIAVMASL
ncbi:hypothetical protein VE03_01499 [Pseudogymnoascus sp. 23342-1-I1]|nr:hypothetical protein VE03_01499 [Pseudogymnoascus sp. 23342-1-I1]